MGIVTVKVGCPHRVIEPIGPQTHLPCAVCRARPGGGWPRWAYAMTVDWTPRKRISEAALTSHAEAPTRFEPIRRPSLAAVVERIRERRRVGMPLAQSEALALAIATAAESVAQQMVFGHSHVEVQPGALDPKTNTVAMRAVMHSRIGLRDGVARGR